jgi:hypothetical protein
VNVLRQENHTVSSLKMASSGLISGFDRTLPDGENKAELCGRFRRHSWPPVSGKKGIFDMFCLLGI